MVTLIQYAPAFGTRSGSPFCVKVEALLRLGKVPYEVEIWHDPRKAPKGKLPVLRDGTDLIADSNWIREHLEANHGCNFDKGLSPEQRAIADAFCKLAEEHLYWAIMQSRWWEDSNWQQLKDVYFSEIPAIMRPLVVPAIRRSTKKQLIGHGMGRHRADEIYKLGKGDIRSIAAYLGGKRYFMGDQPTGVDATIWAFMSAILDFTLPSELQEEAKQHANLVAYLERFKKVWFGDEPAMPQAHASQQPGASSSSA